MIHTLPIPTPFAVGRVNTYLVEDEPLTLVDTGPNSGLSLDRLERSIGERGHRIGDIGLIVLTHQHPDHIGLADIVARRSGAELAGFERLGPWLAEYGESMERDDSYAGELMVRHGVSEQVALALRAVARMARAWGAGATLTRTLRDGDTIALRDRTFSIHHRPGHSPTDIVLFDAERREMIGGDHLIKHISSNPLITPDDPHALISYMSSMRATREMDVATIWPGHGEAITDHVELIDQRLKMHERRAAKIRDLVAAEALTAHDIARKMWGNVAVTQAYLTLSEVLGHLDLLRERGEVEIDEVRGVVRFSAVSA